MLSYLLCDLSVWHRVKGHPISATPWQLSRGNDMANDKKSLWDTVESECYKLKARTWLDGNYCITCPYKAKACTAEYYEDCEPVRSALQELESAIHGIQVYRRK